MQIHTLLITTILVLFCFNSAEKIQQKNKKGYGIFPPHEKDEITKIKLTQKEKDRLTDSERKCKLKSCCRLDDDDDSDSSECSQYTYLKCLSASNTCVWDCSKPRRGVRNLHFKREFHGIDNHDAMFEMDHNLDKDEKVKYSNFIGLDIGVSTVDDCGTIYKYTLKENSLHKEVGRIKETLKAEYTSQYTDGKDDQLSTWGLLRRLLTNNVTKSSEMNDTLRRKLGILDEDGRTGITSWQSPYYKVGYLTYTNNLGRRRCSGALITPRHVLTAGHCVADGEGNFFWDFEFKPSYNAGGSATFKQSQVWVFNDWLYNKNWDWDIAIVTLDTTNTNYGWFGFGWSTGITSNWQFRLAGYPSDKGTTMQTQKAHMDQIFTNILRSTSVDLIPGNSGGPLFLDDQRIYGVGSYQAWRKDSNGNILFYTYNDMVRITQTKYDSMCTYINGWIDNYC